MSAYVRPSQCTKCTPTETHEATNEFITITELAHAAGCPNAPKPTTDRKAEK